MFPADTMWHTGCFTPDEKVIFPPPVEPDKSSDQPPPLGTQIVWPCRNLNMGSSDFLWHLRVLLRYADTDHILLVWCVRGTSPRQSTYMSGRQSTTSLTCPYVISLVLLVKLRALVCHAGTDGSVHRGKHTELNANRWQWKQRERNVSSRTCLLFSAGLF